MWLTTEVSEWAVTKRNMIHYRRSSYSQSFVTPNLFMISWNSKKKKIPFVRKKQNKVKGSWEFAFREQTSWSLVRLNVTTGGEAGSNTLPQKNWGEARGEKTRACFKGKCLSLWLFQYWLFERGGSVQSPSGAPAQRSPRHTGGNGEGSLPSTSFHQERTTQACALLWPLGPAHQG